MSGMRFTLLLGCFGKRASSRARWTFTGPAGLCVVFLDWELAVGKEELRQLPGPLRVRRAHDLGWKPGLWLKSDHDAFAAERVERDKPKRRPLLQRWWADQPAPAEAAPEFT